MKYLLVLLLLIFTVSTDLMGQSEVQTTQIDVMATMVNENSANAVPLKIPVAENTPGKTVEISPTETNSGVVILSGTPYSTVNVRIPKKTIIKNEFGDDAELGKFKLLAGEFDNPSQMDIVTPSVCGEMSIPESGLLYIRVGGTISSDRELRGTYTGEIGFDCDSESSSFSETNNDL